MQTTTTTEQAAAMHIDADVLAVIAADPATATANSSINPTTGSITSNIRTTDPTVVVTVSTQHIGRGQIAGRIEYAVLSYVNAERREGNVRLSAPMSSKRLRVQENVKRRTAKAMREAHAAALRELVDVLAAEPDALASVFANVPGPRGV